MAIRGFASETVRRFYETGDVNHRVGWAALSRIVARKLDMLEYAMTIQDLRSPPANHLELLKGNLKGKYSIRVNERWRIVFSWTAAGAADVDVVDYH